MARHGLRLDSTGAGLSILQPVCLSGWQDEAKSDGDSVAPEVLLLI